MVSIRRFFIKGDEVFLWKIFNTALESRVYPQEISRFKKTFMHPVLFVVKHLIDYRKLMFFLSCLIIFYLMFKRENEYRNVK